MPIRSSDRKILVTGAGGFIGRNLTLSLTEAALGEVRTFKRGDALEALDELVSWADVIVHLAGVNRPPLDHLFQVDNVELTRRIADAALRSERPIHIIFASSIQADRNNAYGTSKRAAEQVLEQLHKTTSAPVSIYRLPNLFGKWCKANYNSVVANLCSAAARKGPLPVDDPVAPLQLVYIDDLVAELRTKIAEPAIGISWPAIEPIYSTTVGELADIITGFTMEAASLTVDRVGHGLRRGLYATYLSHLSPEQFTYPLVEYRDERGMFVEVLKTPDCGQFSFFSSGPGVVRGCHYHHTKTEKFVVVRGRALFRSRNLSNGDLAECEASGDAPRVVQTIPGWVHDVVNIGDENLLVMVWANEVFDRDRPDTRAGEVFNGQA